MASSQTILLIFCTNQMTRPLPDQLPDNTRVTSFTTALDPTRTTTCTHCILGPYRNGIFSPTMLGLLHQSTPLKPTLTPLTLLPLLIRPTSKFRCNQTLPALPVRDSHTRRLYISRQIQIQILRRYNVSATTKF